MITFLIGLILSVSGFFLAGPLGGIAGLLGLVISVSHIKHGNKLAFFPALIGCVVVIFFGLQWVGVIKKDISRTDISNLFDTQMYMIHAVTLLKMNKQVNNVYRDNAIEALEKALEKADKIDVDKIDRFVHGFKEHFEDEFIYGIKSLLDGLKENDEELLSEGKELLNSWMNWNKKVSKKYKKLINKWYSLSDFILN